MSILYHTRKGATMKAPRAGIKDIWNASMAKGAQFSPNDIPLCPTTASGPPPSLITWEEAKAIYKKNYSLDRQFSVDAFVCFYLDDYKFDGPGGIWNNSKQALMILTHFAGIITPDFSTYQDFPEPIKLYATYRMRLFGYWIGKQNISVINNVRWGTEETFSYCFDGIPKESIVCIGTVGGSPRKLKDRARFEIGLKKMVDVLKPTTILVYGSSNYKCFYDIRAAGIRIITYPSQTSIAYKRRKDNE